MDIQIIVILCSLRYLVKKMLFLSLMKEKAFLSYFVNEVNYRLLSFFAHQYRQEEEGGLSGRSSREDCVTD